MNALFHILILAVQHLVTRLGPQLEDRRGLLVSGIQPMARTEMSLEVKKTLAQLIIAMAGHNYLSEEVSQSFSPV